MPTLNLSLKAYKKNCGEDAIDNMFEEEKKHEHNVRVHDEKCDNSYHKN